MQAELTELEGLKSAFEDWRTRRQHNHERLPQELLEKAQRAVEVYGLARVFEATKLDRDKLRGKPNRRRAPVPSFSRVKVSASGAGSQVFAEVEMPTGAKLRLFTQSPEVLHLLSSLCTPGGTR